MPQGATEAAKQEFQMVSGALTNGASTAVSGKLRGEVITFTAGTTEYTGKVNGESMEGTPADRSGRNADEMTEGRRSPGRSPRAAASPKGRAERRRGVGPAY